eukprot:CAMPEP_0113941966 /NCGR_PEP_ID=MMETSP1339-20121228/7780_1 /TAXON_ID=94617 /ORGANISM="Fibrocapsa japonica" /LENGTH=183 /DNA_ID=CAMNT_0000946263 /DNA_START=332 /DNA_END=880 /DNA_ORIENTATION=- /assembly_acc=CAM_ASM_000762
MAELALRCDMISSKLFAKSPMGPSQSANWRHIAATLFSSGSTLQRPSKSRLHVHRLALRSRRAGHWSGSLHLLVVGWVWGAAVVHPQVIGFIAVHGGLGLAQEAVVGAGGGHPGQAVLLLGLLAHALLERGRGLEELRLAALGQPGDGGRVEAGRDLPGSPGLPPAPEGVGGGPQGGPPVEAL